MVKWGFVVGELTKLTTFVHGTIGMFMFVHEELVQALSMACYNYAKSKDWGKVVETAQYAINEICNPMIEWIDAYGTLAYPLHYAYKEFFIGAKKVFESYINLAMNPPK